jgi:hypothetical protein
MIRSSQEHSPCVGSSTYFRPLRVCGEPLIFKSLCPDELHRDVSARPQDSITRQRVTANLLEPASSDELHYDHVPARPQAFLTVIVDRLEPDSSDELLRAFRSLPRQQTLFRSGLAQHDAPK